MLGNIVWNLLSFLVGVGLLTLVHECGHFFVARWCGIKVERFSLGFGKPILQFNDRYGTEYVVCPIPLGGYIKLFGERRDSVSPGMWDSAFSHKPLWQRAAVIGAGPCANFLLAILLMSAIFMIGTPTLKPVIGGIVPGSLADRAAFTPELEIVTIAKKRTPDWESVYLSLASQLGNPKVVVEVRELHATDRQQATFPTAKRQKRILNLQQLKLGSKQQDLLQLLGIKPKQTKIEPVLSIVDAHSAADRAGLIVGDRIIAIEGQPLIEWQQFVQQVMQRPQQPIQLLVQRGEKKLPITLIPVLQKGKKGEEIGYAGVAPQMVPLAPTYYAVQSYGPITACSHACRKTWDWVQMAVQMGSRILTGKLTLKYLGGPIAIAQGAGMAAAVGLSGYLKFLALISVNLGIVNLFPLPILDGGHLLFLTIEALIRRPVPEKIETLFYRLGALSLLFLMGIVLFNDLVCLASR